jgi:hypothetical protein
MIPPLDLLTQSVQHLEQHPESLRIKKLIFFLSKKYWEKDLTFINRFSLEELLQELMQEQPTLGELSQLLNNKVKLLSRPQVYAPLAHTIIEELTKLYLRMSKFTAQVSIASNDDLPSIDYFFSAEKIDEVTTKIANHPEKSRISKLLYSASLNRWEKNPQKLSRPELKNLILNLYQLYPSQQNLQIALSKIVEKVSKPELYQSIAQIVLEALIPLYDTQSSPAIALEMTSSSLPYAPRRDRPQTLSKNEANTAKNKKKLGEIPKEKAQSSRAKYDLFELRLTIMQYTNPLWAKILLYSILIQPWNSSRQDWASLRSHTLDSLMEQLILSGMRLPEIEVNLQSAARSLSETDTALQAAHTLIETIRPFVY